MLGYNNKVWCGSAAPDAIALATTAPVSTTALVILRHKLGNPCRMPELTECWPTSGGFIQKDLMPWLYLECVTPFLYFFCCLFMIWGSQCFAWKVAYADVSGMQIELVLETAVSSDIMPNSKEIQSRGTWGQVLFSLGLLQIWEWLLSYVMESAHLLLTHWET